MRSAAAALLLAAGFAGFSLVPAFAQNRSDETIEGRTARPGITGSGAGSVSAAPNSTGPAIADAAVSFSTSVSIPTITTVGSSMDEAALRDTLSGGFANHVEELAKLTATSISIPELTLTITVSAAAGGTNQVIYRDIELKDVKNGVAASVSVGSTQTQSGSGAFKFGRLQASAFDLGGLLGLYGFVGTGGNAMRTVYKDFSFEGGSVDAGAVQCSFGKVTAAEFSARPLSVSLDELAKAAQVLEAAGDTMPPEAMGTVVRFLTDVFQAFQSSPTNVGPMSCTGTDETGQPFEATIGGIIMEGYKPGIYPAITVSGLKISGAAGSTVALDSATLKAIDLTPTIAALSADAGALSASWFEANGRKLIPAVGGFALQGLKIDVSNPSVPGGRLQASIGQFDLTLGNYVNGIPTLVSTSASGVEMPIPQDDPDMAMLRQLGIERVNMGYELNAHWDESTQTLNIDRAAINGENLGSAAVALHLGAATAALFDLNPDTQMQAGMGVTIKDFSLDLADSGLGDALLPLAGQQQGLTPQQFREQMAAGIEGLAVQTLGRSDNARALGAAVGDFVAGTKTSLSIRVTSKDEAGVPLAALMTIFDGAENPMTLIPTLQTLVEVTGSAQ